MCWLCAHHVVDHGRSVSHAYLGDCKCSAADIFPWKALGATDEEREARLDGIKKRRNG